MVPLLVKTQLDRGMPQEMLVRSATQYVEDTDIHLGQRRGWDQPGGTADGLQLLLVLVGSVDGRRQSGRAMSAPASWIEVFSCSSRLHQRPRGYSSERRRSAAEKIGERKTTQGPQLN